MRTTAALTVCAWLVSAVLPVSAGQLDRSVEVADYIQVFESGSLDEQRLAVQDLQWKGISDQRLFDVIEARLKAGYFDETIDLSTKTVKWYMYALAYSGQDAYLPTLERVRSESSSLRRSAAKAVDILPTYHRWNTIINSDRRADAGEPIEVQLVYNMLDSRDYQLQAMAGKRIYFSDVKFNTGLTDHCADEALRLLNDSTNSKLHLEATAWLAKALGATNDPRYVPVLETLAGDDSPMKVQRHAGKALKQLHKHSHWNEIINAGVDPTAADAEARRVINMLGSGDVDMTRYAAKRIWHTELKHQVTVTDQAEKALLELGDGQSTDLDMLAWLCKALGSTHNVKYRDSILAVKSRYSGSRFQQHAGNALQMLDGS